MKKILAILFSMILFFSPLLTVPAFADGDGNMEGGGGDMGDGTQASYWTVGNEGVRVSVIRINDKALVGTVVDLTNISPTNPIHFGKTNKLKYSAGARLAVNSRSYIFKNPDEPLPRIISVGDVNNIAAIKGYFTDEGVLRSVAEKTGVPYEQLTGGQYKLLVEPLAYFKYKGNFMAMTAHEAALYDEIENGGLRREMGFLTHQNLPFSIFLETPDLGFPAWNGGTASPTSNSAIKSSLGLGIVRFTDAPPIEQPDPPPDAAVYDYEYRTDTDVITSVRIYSGEEITPDDDAEVVFTIGGRTYTKSFVCPASESQLVWVKWHTPTTPTQMQIDVDISHGSAEKSTITANIVALEEITPPDPKGTDTAPMGFYLPTRPKDFGDNRSAQWGEWYAVWHEVLVWEEGDCDRDGCERDHGRWVDEGYWEYTWKDYSLAVEAKSEISPDERCPTAISRGSGDWEMKSGYGVKNETTAKLYSDGGFADYDVTGAQNAVAVFSEFGYKDFNRLLEVSEKTLESTVFGFKKNPYSQWENPSHFTPAWYPNEEKYTVVTVVFDVWTPAGQLYITTNDSVDILGSCFDDWKVRPVIR